MQMPNPNAEELLRNIPMEEVDEGAEPEAAEDPSLQAQKEAEEAAFQKMLAERTITLDDMGKRVLDIHFELENPEDAVPLSEEDEEWLHAILFSPGYVEETSTIGAGKHTIPIVLRSPPKTADIPMRAWIAENSLQVVGQNANGEDLVRARHQAELSAMHGTAWAAIHLLKYNDEDTYLTHLNPEDHEAVVARIEYFLQLPAGVAERIQLRVSEMTARIKRLVNDNRYIANF